MCSSKSSKALLMCAGVCFMQVISAAHKNDTPACFTITARCYKTAVVKSKYNKSDSSTGRVSPLWRLWALYYFFILYCIKTIALMSAIKEAGPDPSVLLNQTAIFCSNFSVSGQKQAHGWALSRLGFPHGQQHRELVLGPLSSVISRL